MDELYFAGTVNRRCDVRERFSWLDKKLRGQLSEKASLSDMIRLTEMLLVKKLETAKNNVLVDKIVGDILLHQGALEIGRLSKDNFVSGRQMERLFHEYIGITPKKLCNLVRYQCLWKDIVSQNDFDIMDAVYKYGYTDSAHLMREFRRYHSLNIRAAKELAFRQKAVAKRLQNVGNIQDISGWTLYTLFINKKRRHDHGKTESGNNPVSVI